MGFEHKALFRLANVSYAAGGHFTIQECFLVVNSERTSFHGKVRDELSVIICKTQKRSLLLLVLHFCPVLYGSEFCLLVSDEGNGVHQAVCVTEGHLRFLGIINMVT